MKIIITGTGYVGPSNAVLLAQHTEFFAVNIEPEKVELLNHELSLIAVAKIENFLVNKSLNLAETLDKVLTYKAAYFTLLLTLWGLL